MVNELLVTFMALLLAYVMSEVFRHFGLPRVIGQILAGVVLGTAFFRNLLQIDQIIPAF